jgi:GAF domain-containing protein
MKRRGKAGGKVIKTQRRRTLRRHTATKAAGRRKLSAVDETERIALLEHRLNEALEQQSATSEVLRVISSSPSEIQSVLDGIAAAAARLLDVADADIMRAEGQLMRCVAKHGPSPQWEIGSTRAINRDWVTGRAVIDRKTVHVHDLQAAKSEFPEGAAYAKQYGHRTTLATPLLREGNPIGAFLIRRNYVKPFTNEQVELVQNFAAQAVIAIENARLLNELRQRTGDLGEALEQQTATSEVLKVISSSPGDLKPVFQSMLENATRICEASFGAMALSEGDILRRVALYNAPPKFMALHEKAPFIDVAAMPTMHKLVTTKQVVHTADLQIEDPKNLLAVYAGARTLLLVPLLKENEFIGVFGIYRQEVRPFTDKQIELVQTFAAQAVIAIENTRLLSELRESLQQQTATADVLKVISRSTFDLRIVLQTLVESAGQLCGADKATITRQKDGSFLFSEAYGGSHEFIEFMRTIPIKPERGTAAGRALLEGRVIHIQDVKADPEYTFAGAQKLGDFRTILAVPMLRERIPIGVLALMRSDVQPFTDKQIELVTTFADQAAIAIENVRLFEDVQKRTRELSEALEQQTATSEVLKIISSSPGELEPIFDAMLANAKCDHRHIVPVRGNTISGGSNPPQRTKLRRLLAA